MPTPYTWSDGETPSAEQALAWLLSAEPGEQLAVVGNLMHNARLAEVCVMQNHNGVLQAAAEKVQGLLAGNAEAYVKIAQVRRLHIANGQRQCVAGCGQFPCKTAKAVYQRIELER